MLKRFVLNYLRIWDRMAADRPDFLLANSVYTQKRIEKYYRRDSVVIYPPIGEEKVHSSQSIVHSQDAIDETNKLKANEAKSYKLGGYFLVVSRLSPYKKVDVVVEAFNKLGLPLVVIGQGEQEKHLKKIAKENVQILGWKDDATTEQYYKNAKAFIFPAEDDFGMTAVEAMNFGVPVIAFRKGGVLETVQEGITGEFFDAQTPEVLADGVRRFLDNEKNYDKEVIGKRGGQFSRERFVDDMRKFIDGVVEKK